jgi:hypothetical protein
MRFEVLTAVKVSMLVLWLVTSCGIVSYIYMNVFKMAVMCSSETLVSAYEITRRYNPEGQHRRHSLRIPSLMDNTDV